MLYLLSSTVITTPGLSYDSQIISAETARRLVRERPWTSAFGHASTAAVASTLLGVEVPVSRQEVFLADGDDAICVKLRGRAPEGKVLSREEVEAIGFDLVLLSARNPGHQKLWAARMLEVAELLCLPDAPAEGEQPPGTRRRGRYPYPMWACFVVRLPLADGGRYLAVTRALGSADSWDVELLSAEEADEMTKEPSCDDSLGDSAPA